MPYPSVGIPKRRNNPPSIIPSLLCVKPSPQLVPVQLVDVEEHDSQVKEERNDSGQQERHYERR